MSRIYRSKIDRPNWGDDSSDESDTADDKRLLRDGQITTYQALENHERGLDRLSEAVKSQKNVAHSLATEVDLHNEILDDIDTGLAATDINLRKNTRNIKLISRKSSTCCLWMIVVMLAVVIGLLAFL